MVELEGDPAKVDDLYKIDRGHPMFRLPPEGLLLASNW